MIGYVGFGVVFFHPSDDVFGVEGDSVDYLGTCHSSKSLQAAATLAASKD